MSRIGYGNGFASRQQRFNSTTMSSLTQSNHNLELIYARASASPGPGHYNHTMTPGMEMGGKFLFQKQKKFWNSQKKLKKVRLNNNQHSY
jgi:hypothetical protein